jgi:hypothetical protein
VGPRAVDTWVRRRGGVFSATREAILELGSVSGLAEEMIAAIAYPWHVRWARGVDTTCSRFGDDTAPGSSDGRLGAAHPYSPECVEYAGIQCVTPNLE